MEGSVEFRVILIGDSNQVRGCLPDENSRDLFPYQRNSEKAILDLENPTKNRKILRYSNFL